MSHELVLMAENVRNKVERRCRIGKVTPKKWRIDHSPHPYWRNQAPNLGNVESLAAREARLLREKAAADSGREIVEKIEAERAAAQAAQSAWQNGEHLRPLWVFAVVIAATAVCLAIALGVF